MFSSSLPSGPILSDASTTAPSDPTIAGLIHLPRRLTLSLKDPCNSVWAQGLGTKPENRYHSVFIQRVSADHELSSTLNPGPSTLFSIRVILLPI